MFRSSKKMAFCAFSLAVLVAFLTSALAFTIPEQRRRVHNNNNTKNNAKRREVKHYMVPPSWTAAIAAGALPEALVPLVTGAAGFVIGRQSELLLQREDVKLKLKEYEDVLKQSWEEIQQDVVQFARQVEAQTRELVLWNTLRAIIMGTASLQDTYKLFTLLSVSTSPPPSPEYFECPVSIVPWGQKYQATEPGPLLLARNDSPLFFAFFVAKSETPAPKGLLNVAAAPETPKPAPLSLKVALAESAEAPKTDNNSTMDLASNIESETPDDEEEQTSSVKVATTTAESKEPLAPAKKQPLAPMRVGPGVRIPVDTSSPKYNSMKSHSDNSNNLNNSHMSDKTANETKSLPKPAAVETERKVEAVVEESSLELAAETAAAAAAAAAVEAGGDEMELVELDPMTVADHIAAENALEEEFETGVKEESETDVEEEFETDIEEAVDEYTLETEDESTEEASTSLDKIVEDEATAETESFQVRKPANKTVRHVVGIVEERYAEKVPKATVAKKSMAFMGAFAGSLMKSLVTEVKTTKKEKAEKKAKALASKSTLQVEASEKDISAVSRPTHEEIAPAPKKELADTAEVTLPQSHQKTEASKTKPAPKKSFVASSKKAIAERSESTPNKGFMPMPKKVKAPQSESATKHDPVKHVGTPAFVGTSTDRMEAGGAVADLVGKIFNSREEETSAEDASVSDYVPEEAWRSFKEKVAADTKEEAKNKNSETVESGMEVEDPDEGLPDVISSIDRSDLVDLAEAGENFFIDLDEESVAAETLVEAALNEVKSDASLGSRAYVDVLRSELEEKKDETAPSQIRGAVRESAGNYTGGEDPLMGTEEDIEAEKASKPVQAYSPPTFFFASRVKPVEKAPTPTDTAKPKENIEASVHDGATPELDSGATMTEKELVSDSPEVVFDGEESSGATSQSVVMSEVNSVGHVEQGQEESVVPIGDDHEVSVGEESEEPPITGNVKKEARVPSLPDWDLPDTISADAAGQEESESVLDWDLPETSPSLAATDLESRPVDDWDLPDTKSAPTATDLESEPVDDWDLLETNIGETEENKQVDDWSLLETNTTPTAANSESEPVDDWDLLETDFEATEQSEQATQSWSDSEVAPDSWNTEENEPAVASETWDTEENESSFVSTNAAADAEPEYIQIYQEEPPSGFSQKQWWE